MSWLRAPTSGRSRPRRSSRAPTATSPSNGWRSSRRARAWTAWWRGSRADTRAAAWPSWATSPISADWFARCSPTRAGRSWSSARARLACSSSPARWAGARRRSIGFSVRNTSGCSAPRMTKRPDNLLAAPAPGAAHRIALSLLDAATAARERLPDTGDAEALHDFRVAMRRLRSTLRAYQPQLEAVPAKLRRRLRDLARATGEARDVEVQISWLERQRNELPAARRAGVPWLLSRLTQRRERAYQDIRERIAPKFDRLARRLRRALGSVPPPDATLPASLASLIAQLLEDQGSDLERRLALIRSPASHAEAHAARIRVKRARYLLEPVVREAKPAAAVVRRLKQVQQLLGDLHDLQVVIVRLGDAAAEAAAQRTRRLHELAVGGDRGAGARGPRPATSGLLALSRVARATQERLFRRLVSRRLARSLPAELTALAAELRPPAPIVAAAPAARRHLPLPARYTHRARA